MGTMRRASLAVLALVALLLGTLVATDTASAADPVSFTVRPSVNQLYVLDATPGQALELIDAADAVVASGTVDTAGSLAWRDLDAGTYRVRTTSSPATVSDPATVTDFDDPAPPHSFYAGQTMTKGFGYITTRDGTTLSANVSLPPGKGPFPTVVEYSGYAPSNPADSTFAQIYTNLGYAYVGVNVRGTGCSGGSFRAFEPIQSLDGYDVIETIAAQPWAKFHKVGMVGISYPGIEQLYVAQTEPPHLAAISPLSVIDDTYRGTLFPGGILNTGFAVSWANERDEQAEPYGQGWEQGQVDAGDLVCKANQDVRLQNPDQLALIEDNPYYSAEIGDPITPSLFAPKINVPIFIAGAWQDEQTGGHFPAMLDDFTGSPHVYATMVNGSHTESLSLGVFRRYANFLDLYVGRRVPGNEVIKQYIAKTLAKTLTGVDGLSLPKGMDFSGLNYQQALRKFEAQKPVRILFEEGAADGQPSGSPLPRFSKSFGSWPIASATPTSWFLTPDGALAGKAPTVAAADTTPRSYTADPSALPATTYTGSSSGIWAAHPTYDWRQIPAGKGLGWITAPLRKTVVTIGTGSLDLWVRSSAADTDLEATISEVRPNGTEIYVQSGWLRASHRKLDDALSTAIYPAHTDLEADASPLPAGEFTQVRLALLPFAQPFRAGSRIRITVDAPGGARPLWAFDQTISHGEQVEIATDAAHPSKLVLPVVAGVDVPKKAPACASLRSQPCRQYP
ncbi:CocE/NonD family hydrolase [Nocardioides sp. CN2-186]|uniref:CocE/NonD family hydrolase n=1 Tax=Nocardioides tweenelious TaxID=3156607 RepID=UPI0032B5D8C6